jgi:hypothetical protein
MMRPCELRSGHAMNSTVRPKNQHARIPLTITLIPESYEFVESYAGHREFSSLDDLFEAALAIYKNHVEALEAYVEREQARGKSVAEIKRKAMPEIVITRRRNRKRV